MSVDTTRLLAALRQVEVSGWRTGLRFEPAYMPRGYKFPLQGYVLTGTGAAMTEVAQRRWDKWGPWSSASYGPWQILYHAAADLGYGGHPCDLLREEVCRVWVEAKLHQISRRGARTLAEIADAWNSGTHRDGIVPHEYIRKVQAAYAALGREETPL